MSMVWEVGGYVSHKLKASAWGDVISRTDPVIADTLAITVRGDEGVYISNVQTYMLNVGKSLNDKTVYNHNSCKYFCVSIT